MEPIEDTPGGDGVTREEFTGGGCDDTQANTVESALLPPRSETAATMTQNVDETTSSVSNEQANPANDEECDSHVSRPTSQQLCSSAESGVDVQHGLEGDDEITFTRTRKMSGWKSLTNDKPRRAARRTRLLLVMAASLAS